MKIGFFPHFGKKVRPFVAQLVVMQERGHYSMDFVSCGSRRSLVPTLCFVIVATFRPPLSRARGVALGQSDVAAGDPLEGARGLGGLVDTFPEMESLGAKLDTSGQLIIYFTR